MEKELAGRRGLDGVPAWSGPLEVDELEVYMLKLAEALQLAGESTVDSKQFGQLISETVLLLKERRVDWLFKCWDHAEAG